MSKVKNILLNPFGFCIILCLVLLVCLHSMLFIRIMKTNTMVPVIGTNDVIVGFKWYRAASLKKGDLVMISYSVNSNKIWTIREMEQIPYLPNDACGVVAVNSNSADPRSYGTIPLSEIEGKVIWIDREYVVH